MIEAIEAQRNELDYDLDGAVLRLADRNAFAAAGTRANSPRGALAFKFAAEEKTTVLSDVIWDVGKIGKVAPVAVLEPVFVGGTTVTRATLANQEVIRARDVRIGDTVLVRRAGDVIPFVAGVLDASKRTGDEREIEPPTRVPVMRAAADRAGQQPRAVLHQRRLPGADRAAADPLGVARRRGHRRDRPGLDRAAQRGRAARAPVRLLRAHARAGCSSSSGSRDVSADRMIESIDRSPRRRPAAGVDRPGDPDGVRGHRRQAVPRRLRAARGHRGRRRGGAPAGRGRRPEGRRQPDAHLNRDTTRAELERLRELGVNLDVLRGGPAARRRRRRPAGRQDGRHHRHDRRPAQRREGPAPGVRAPRPSGPAPTTASAVSSNTDMLITGANVGASKTAKAEKLGVEVVDQEEIWKLLIDGGVA